MPNRESCMLANQLERPCFRSSVRGTIHGWYEGSFIDGSRDSKYDLHRHVLLPLQLGDDNDRDLNPLCIFILILGDHRAIFFVFYYVSQYSPIGLKL
jgi:hypothetical protein